MGELSIWCCGCNSETLAVLITGADVYPHRRDLSDVPFWRCPTCRNFVGCHHKTAERTKPLGFIATPELKAARQKIHAALDPIWQAKKKPRREIYRIIADKIGVDEYHTAQIISLDMADRVLAVVKQIGGTHD